MCSPKRRQTLKDRVQFQSRTSNMLRWEVLRTVLPAGNMWQSMSINGSLDQKTAPVAEVSNPHHGVPSVNSSMTVPNWESHNYCKQDYDLVGRSYVSRQPSRDHFSQEGKWQTCEQGKVQFQSRTSNMLRWEVLRTVLPDCRQHVIKVCP